MSSDGSSHHLCYLLFVASYKMRDIWHDNFTSLSTRAEETGEIISHKNL